jgi:acid phosphatase family membrane protein YuiD
VLHVAPTWLPHPGLTTGFFALFLAQVIKFFSTWIGKRTIDFRALVTTGGMPSSHTALVVALTTTVGLIEGFSSTMFDVSLVFASIVMYDAAGVRQAAGRQARVLNQIVADLQGSLEVKPERLKELLGHTPLEVIGGAILGVGVALLMHRGV